MLKTFSHHYIADRFVWDIPHATTRSKNIWKLANCFVFGSDRVKIIRWGLSNSKCHLLAKLVSADRNMTECIMSWRSARSAWLVVWYTSPCSSALPSATGGWHHAWRQAFVTLSWCTVSTHTLNRIRELRIFFILLLVRRGSKEGMFFWKICLIVSIKTELSAEMMFLVVVRDRVVMNMDLDLNEGMNEWMTLSVSCMLIHWRSQTANCWVQLLTSKECPAWSYCKMLFGTYFTSVMWCICEWNGILLRKKNVGQDCVYCNWSACEKLLLQKGLKSKRDSWIKRNVLLEMYVLGLISIRNF